MKNHSPTFRYFLFTGVKEWKGKAIHGKSIKAIIYSPWNEKRKNKTDYVNSSIKIDANVKVTEVEHYCTTTIFILARSMNLT